ncbi:MAG: hypothetical protein KF680_00460 [Cryobacterium sp.]|nr:hypothetical protein [Cryobacterium sp.]
MTEVHHPRLAIFDHFDAPQQEYDLLPHDAPALLTITPGSSRYLGSAGVHRFFVGLGRVAGPYCVIVTDVYGAQVAQQCGGATFEGAISDGLRFSFGAFAAPSIAGAFGGFGLGPHLLVEAETVDPLSFAAVAELVSRLRVSGDRRVDGTHLDGFLSDGTLRLLAVDGEHQYFLGLTDWPAARLCLFEVAQRGADEWMTGTCGGRDIAIESLGGAVVHFSAVGFADETPDGWRQISKLLRVSVTPADPGEARWGWPPD